MTPMMNNPVMALAAALRGGQNPMALMQSMAARDPRMAQAMRIMQGKNPRQLEEIARNMARERGMSVEDIARNLGVTVPSNR